MNWLNIPSIAFEGSNAIAQGALKDVAVASKLVMDRSSKASHPLPVLIFDQRSGETIELDWRGSEVEFLRRLGHRAEQMDALTTNLAAATAPASTVDTTEGDPGDGRRGPGRPRLGVVAREVTLLPRHWDWLASQTGGASVALRKLVEVARLSSEVKDRARKAREVGYKFMSTMAGHEAGFEEASRALFAGNQSAFDLQIAPWPEDVQRHLKKLLADAFEGSP
jgi:uncharacterized protein